MKKSLLAILTITTLTTSGAFAGMAEDALKLVPGGKVVAEKAEEVKVQVPNGGIVEVEFQAGKFEEASGDSVEHDIFIPGQGLLSLKDAVEAMKKAGKTPVGEWSLDNSFLKGWHYEFEGHENGKKMDYIVDAKSGKLLDAKVDD